MKRLTEHLGGKHDTERPIADDLAVCIAQLAFLACLAVGGADRDDEIGVVGYLVNASELRVPESHLTGAAD